jgi:hypothetical protein
MPTALWNFFAYFGMAFACMLITGLFLFACASRTRYTQCNRCGRVFYAPDRDTFVCHGCKTLDK